MTETMTIPVLTRLALPDLPATDLGGMLALTDAAERPLPLLSVRVRATIAGDCCRTEIAQRFANPYTTPLEAIHIFPLPPEGAVTEMVLIAGGREVRAECREREEAERLYAAALTAGHRAGMLTAERADVHTLRVGGLPPETEVTVRMVVHERLAHVDGRFVWRFPTVIAPRYLPGQSIGHTGPGALPDTDHVPDASRLQPPLRLEGGALFDLEVALAGPVTAVSSSLHAIGVTLADGPGGSLRIAPHGRATLDRDFVLTFTAADADHPASRAWTDGAYTLVVVEPPADVSPAAMPRDAVFVVDISGSMSGTKIEAARRAVAGALHGLAEGDRFMLLAFDDRLERLDEGFVPYNESALARADRWIAALEARGGTEMLPAVTAALAGDTPFGRLRTVLLITDGQVWDDAELVAAVAHRRGDTRFFTMGIDTAVNVDLLQRLARVGGGACALHTPADDIEGAVAGLEARFGSPLIDGLTVDTADAAADTVAGSPGVVVADDRPRTVFAGRPATFLLDGAPPEVHLVGRTVAGAWEARVVPSRAELPLGPLWARERVAALDDRAALHPHEAEGLRPEILKVALAHGILSRYTAFVAVDTSVTTTGERVTVVQPVELPLGWDERFRAPAAGGFVVSCASVMLGPLGIAEEDTRSVGRLYELRMPSLPRGAARRPASRASGHAARRGGPAVGAPPGPGEDAPPQDAAARLAGDLARSQSADGSFGGDVGRTAAALAALVLLGHTRRRGARRRTVAKAAAWLAAHDRDPRAATALDVLSRAEGGVEPATLRAESWDDLMRWPEFAGYADVIWPDAPPADRAGA